MDFLASVVGFVVGLGILVFVHELGHFLMAKWCGVRVEKFSIGFPPKIISFTKGDTEYVIGATPLGGYVKMAGMIDENMDGEVTGAPDEFASKNAWQKSLILLGGVLFNLIFAIVVLFSLTMVNGKTKILNTEIQTIDPRSPLKKYIPEPNITITHIDETPLDYYTDISEMMMQRVGDSYPISYTTAAGESKQFYVPENFELGEDLFARLDFRYTFQSQIYVDSLAPNSYAAQIGLQKNDTIVAIDGAPVTSFSRLEELKRSVADTDAKLVVKRQASFDTLDIHLKTETDGSVLIGFATGIRFPSDEWIKSKFVQLDYTAGEALGASVDEAVRGIVLNYKSIRTMIRGDLDVSENVGGPIAIANVLGKSIGNVSLFLRVVAIISIMLAFMNVLPIPGLDGGHLLLVIIEGVRGKPLQLETKMKIQKAGIAFLFTLMIFVITNDVSRLF